MPVLLLLALLAPLARAKDSFPANHPDLDWYSIETEHFVVHYPASHRGTASAHALSAERAARRSAEIAEDVYPRECAALSYWLKEKVHIVILEQGDDLEGFAVPGWDWIQVSANPGLELYRQRGRTDWLSAVIAHELAHVLSLKAQMTHAEGTPGVVIGGLYSGDGLDADVGGQLVVGDNPSAFWVEGAAEYAADEAGYNVWSSSRDMLLRTSILEDRQLTWAEWKVRDQRWTWSDPERYYQQGYSFGLYIRERFGHDAFLRLGLDNAKAWRADWDEVFQRVLGVEGEALYGDWLAAMRERYEAQYDAVKTAGETRGRELSMDVRAWEYTDPDGRDAWNDPRWSRSDGVTGPDLAKIEREQAKLGTGTNQLQPRFSGDGKWYGYVSDGGVHVSQVREGSFTAFAAAGEADDGDRDRAERTAQVLPARSMASWDFVPGQDALVVVGSEHSRARGMAHGSGLQLETSGYDWSQLYVAPLVDEPRREGKLRYRGHAPRTVLGRPVAQAPRDWATWRPIPNTLRGTEPAVSPDGARVAYLEYADGTLNLVTIKLDGSEKVRLTQFDDGTWMQRADWSPDGKQLVVAVDRNSQEDLYLVNADGSGVRALTWDRWEELDPDWEPDGRIVFSSDASGIFNVYAMDVATGTVTQLTNVVGGAESASLTPGGNLVFANYSAHGWKMWGLRRAEFLDRDATASFGLEVRPETVAESWKYHEDLSRYVPERYRGELMPPTGSPIVRVSNDRGDLSVQAGAEVYVQDYVQDHGLLLQALVGADTLLLGEYTFRGWYPTFVATGMRYEDKYTFDVAGESTTDADAVVERKNQRYEDLAALQVRLPWNDHFSTSLVATYLDYGFRTSDAPRFQPYQRSVDARLDVAFTTSGTGQRDIDLSLTRGYTDVIYAPYGGRVQDDGEVLDAYGYDRVDLRWTEAVRVPEWGPVLSAASRHHHVVELDVQGGFVDQNVDRNDELHAGGQHPYSFGTDALRSNTQFAGYPAYSLSGETLAVVQLAYGFPLRRYLDAEVGPLYVHDVRARLTGSAGNVWSFRAPDVAGAAPRREVPLVDKAADNGNYMLFDAGGEVRVGASLFTRPWNCFVRVAYGFNELRSAEGGQPALGEEQASDVEAPGPRFYLGFGTGW